MTDDGAGRARRITDRAFRFSIPGRCDGGQLRGRGVTGRRRGRAAAPRPRRSASDPARARAKARKLAKNAAANEKWVQGYPALHLLTRDDINALDVSDWARHTLLDLLNKAESFGMSGKQAEFAASLITEGLNNAQFAPLKAVRAAAEEAAKPQAPTGRQIIEGEVTSYYTDLKTFGYNETITRQITITTAEGWKVKVTAPSALIAAATDAEEAEFRAGTREEVRSDYREAYGYTDNHPLIGRRVRLTATLEASPKREVDYGKRPTKSELV